MLGNFGYKYAIREHDAYENLKRVEDKPTMKEFWYPQYKYRRDIAKLQYEEVRNSHGRHVRDELFFTEIIENRIEIDDPAVSFPRQTIEDYECIDNEIFKESDELKNYGIFPGAI